MSYHNHDNHVDLFRHSCQTCKKNKIFPINHLKYRNNTYFKNDRKSQIDFVLATSKGKNDIITIEVINYDWHLSDHIPLYVNVYLNSINSSADLLARAEDLNYEYKPLQMKVERFNRNYKTEAIDDFIMQNKKRLKQKSMKHNK